MVLEYLSDIKRLKENDPHDTQINDLEERISIILGGNKIDDIEYGINDAAYKYSRLFS